MGRFDSVPDIEGRLDDFEIQCITDWLGDPVRNFLDQSIEKDVFEPYENGQYCDSLIRLGTCISAVLLKMISTKCPLKNMPSPKKVSGGWLLDLKPFREICLLREFKKCFKERIPNQLIEDIHVIQKLRNAYAHRLTPIQDIFGDEHKTILKALRDTWQDLRNEYVKIVF